MYQFGLKPILDFILSALILIISSPVLILISFILLIFQKSNPYFTQIRPGKNENHFLLIKFKTMKDERDENGKLLPDKDRLTRIGKFIRSTSLDELPQLINVLKGDMSLIGPRPLLVKYLEHYSSEQSRRHEVKPGITGWAQVNGRNAISWEKKLKLDVWYVDHLSFKLDLLILIKTIYKIFKREDINAQGSVTMTEFFGNNKE
jgi:lipopolysaccharide/colanic/teichoic acid biosynthesis glycosyltransferase